MPVISNPPPGMMMYGPPGAPPGPYGPMRPQSPPPEIMYSHVGDPPPGMMMYGPPGPPPEIMYSHVGDPPGAPQQQPMAMVPRGRSRPPSHIPLAKLRVLYLGSAVPLQTREGLQAVQGPLRERYPYMSDGDVSGIDAWLTIFSSGILMKYLNETNTVAWFPIQSFHVCAAVKCVVTGVGPQRQANFVALDSPEGRSSKHPPMFACIMRRTKGVKVLECHAFITKSNQAALAAVQACTHAYDHKEGWTDDFPNTDGQHNSNESRLVAADPVPVSTAPPEFFEKPPVQGYFYTSKKDLIKTYKVFGDRRGDSMVQTAAPRQARSDMRPAPKRQLAPPPAPMSAMPVLGPTLPLPPPMGVPTPDSQLGLFPPGAIPMAQPPIFMPGLGPGMLPPGVQFIAPPQPPASVLANGHPLMMPAPPAGYFADYDRYAGQPFNVFPLEPNERSSRSRHKKHRHKKSFHSPPKVREVRRARSASPAYSTSDIYGDYDYDDQYVYDERPPREPREEREVARRPERRADPPERSQKFRDGIPRDYDYDDQYVYDKRPPREPREEREVARRPERRADPPERSERGRDGIPHDYDYDDQYVYDKRPPREPREEREVARRPERRADPPERSEKFRDGIPRDYDYDDQYVYDKRPPREPREEREVARRPERRSDPPQRSDRYRDGIPRDYDYDDQYVYDERPPREPREEREVARRPERRADPPERFDR